MALPAPLRHSLRRVRNTWRLLLTLIFLISGGSLVLGLIALTAYRQGVFERQLEIRVRVPDAKGLRPGSRVTLSGVQVGVLRWLEVQNDGQVLLQLTVPARYRGVVSPASSISISQDFLMGDRQLKLRPAPAPATTVPDRFVVAYHRGPNLDDLIAQIRGSFQRLDALLASGNSLSTEAVPRTLAQLRESLRRVDAVSNTLVREVPPTAAVLRQTGREAGGTAREARSGIRELVLTLEQIRPQLSRALQQLNVSAEEAGDVLGWLNRLIDQLDPSWRLRRLGPKAPSGPQSGASPPALPPSAPGAAPQGSE